MKGIDPIRTAIRQGALDLWPTRGAFDPLGLTIDPQLLSVEVESGARAPAGGRPTALRSRQVEQGVQKANGS